MLTDEGLLLAPTVADALARIEQGIDLLRGGVARELLTVGVVGTFAVGFLMRHLPDFRRRFPHIELRLLTNNNKPDASTDSLDLSIRFGDGAWRSVEAVRVMAAPMARSEEHTSELQSLMRISYAVFCLKKKKQ